MNRLIDAIISDRAEVRDQPLEALCAGAACRSCFRTASS